jgi:hypothetical protein
MGSTYQLVVTSPSAGALSYSSSSVATVNASGLITFNSSGTATITVTQAANASFYAPSAATVQVTVAQAPGGGGGPPTLAISSICFPGETLIDTDEGKIRIDLLEKDKNTIRGMRIVGITETVSKLKYLVCIEKNALGKNIPCIETIISPNHRLLYNREMVEARYLLEVVGVYPIKYSGEILYNVLLERHEKMIVNNLIVETLDPSNVIAQMYSEKYNKEKREHLIKTWNNFITTQSEKEYRELSKYIY